MVSMAVVRPQSHNYFLYLNLTRTNVTRRACTSASASDRTQMRVLAGSHMQIRTALVTAQTKTHVFEMDCVTRKLANTNANKAITT